MEVQFGHRVTPARNVLLRRVDTDLVLLHLGSELYFGLDEMGTAMWQALADRPTIEEAYQMLLGEYDVDPAELRADLATLVRKLAESGLIEVTAGPPEGRE